MVYTETKFSVTRFNADNAPQPEGLRCVSVYVPDDDFYVNLLASCFGLATKATNWEGEQENRDACALLCNIAYTESGFDDCMNCATVQECIETDEGVQGALIEQINNAITTNETTINSILQMLQEQNSPGNPLQNPDSPIVPPETFETDGDCDLDKLWAGCMYLSEYLDTLVSDFFDTIASLTEEAAIVAKASGAIPVLGDYIQSAIEFSIALQEKIAVSYAGEQTQELKESIACSFFCQAQLGCTLSADDAINVMVERLGEISPEEFGAIIDILITHTFEGVQIVEMAYLLALTAIKFGQQFGGVLGTRPLGQIMAIGASDPSDAWTIICDPCALPWCVHLDATNGLDTFFSPAGGAGEQAVWTGTGWAYNPAVLVGRVTLEGTFASPTNLYRVVVVQSAPTTAGDIQQIVAFSPTFADTIGSASSATATVDIAVDDGMYDNLLLDVEADTNAAIDPIPGEITDVYLYGVGTAPEIGTPCE